MTESALRETNMPKLPGKLWLSRGEVMAAVGGKRTLERLERAGRLRREHPGGIRHARYSRISVRQLLDEAF